MLTVQPKPVIAIIAGLAALAAGPAFASTWISQLASGSAAETQSSGLPVAPGGVAAACTSSTNSKITVTWTAVSRASSYTVYQSTTSATTGYSVAASGVVGTSWTSAALTSGNYWFELSAAIGTNWSSAKSAASGESTVVKSTSCVQP